jgi:hypothetical protein
MEYPTNAPTTAPATAGTISFHAWNSSPNASSGAPPDTGSPSPAPPDDTTSPTPAPSPTPTPTIAPLRVFLRLESTSARSSCEAWNVKAAPSRSVIARASALTEVSVPSKAAATPLTKRRASRPVSSGSACAWAAGARPSVAAITSRAITGTNPGSAATSSAVSAQ